MQVTPLIWLITIAVTILFFVYEFFAHVRKPHEPSIAESARWSAFYIGLALLFGVGIGAVSGWTFGGEYFAGYLTEKALSIDNLFVFLIVMAGFAVPKKYQQKVLMIGIIIALILRGGFIAIGATLIENFSWVFYIFGALLLVLAYRQAFSSHGFNLADGKSRHVCARSCLSLMSITRTRSPRCTAGSVLSRQCCSQSMRSASWTSFSPWTQSLQSTV